MSRRVVVSAPGKLMISGEYVVLDDAPALVAAVGAAAGGVVVFGTEGAASSSFNIDGTRFRAVTERILAFKRGGLPRSQLMRWLSIGRDAGAGTLGPDDPAVAEAIRRAIEFYNLRAGAGREVDLAALRLLDVDSTRAGGDGAESIPLHSLVFLARAWDYVDPFGDWERDGGFGRWDTG